LAINEDRHWVGLSEGAPRSENTGIRADTREAEGGNRGIERRRRHLGARPSGLAARQIIEQALEGQARDALGREHYARCAAPGRATAKLSSGTARQWEGRIEYSAPQIADRAAPFRSAIREIVRGRTAELEALAVKMYARALSTRDIEALLADATGSIALSRTAVSQITERLWAEYEQFAGRDLAEFDVV
jgi:transposase-like protein